MRQGEFKCSNATANAFKEIKKNMVEALVMCLPKFTEVFEMECDASGIHIGGVFNQERHPIAYFSENMNEAKQRYSTYNKELYIVV